MGDYSGGGETIKKYERIPDRIETLRLTIDNIEDFKQWVREKYFIQERDTSAEWFQHESDWDGSIDRIYLIRYNQLMVFEIGHQYVYGLPDASGHMIVEHSEDINPDEWKTIESDSNENADNPDGGTPEPNSDAHGR